MQSYMPRGDRLLLCRTILRKGHLAASATEWQHASIFRCLDFQGSKKINREDQIVCTAKRTEPYDVYTSIMYVSVDMHASILSGAATCLAIAFVIEIN